MIAYLEDYAGRFGVAPVFGQQVQSLRRDGESWLTRSQDAT